MNSFPSTKTYYLVNLGCAKNQVDAEVMLNTLDLSGYSEAAEAEKADYIIINTCAFISEAKEQAINTVLEYRNAYPDKKVLVAGCFAQRYGQDLASLLPEVDGIFGNAEPSLVTDMLQRMETETMPVFMPLRSSFSAKSTAESKTDLKSQEKANPGEKAKPYTDSGVSVSNQSAGHVPAALKAPIRRKRMLSFPNSAYVKIAEGCRNLCSFCAIPIIRGTVRSRSVEDVISEIHFFLEQGIFEINLIAQDLAGFGTDRGESELIRLLKNISLIKGNFWIRLLYIHPDNFPYQLLDVCAEDQRILPYFDLPFQHVSPRLLKKMNRKGSPETYLKLVRHIRGKLPGAVIRSTFLLGFPGENRTDRKMLKQFIADAELNWVGFFEYSPEEGTPARKIRRKPTEIGWKKRAGKFRRQLEQLQQQITFERLDRFVGKTLKVLVEEEVPEENLVLGRAYIHAPEVDGLVVLHGEDIKPGQIVNARITRRNSVDFVGVALDG